MNQDLLNQLLNLSQHDHLFQLRQKRAPTVDATQKFFGLIITLDIPSLTIVERTYVAIYTASLIKQPQLKNYFLNSNSSLSLSIIALIEQNNIARITDAKIREILTFTAQVVLHPDHSSPDNLVKLEHVGLTIQAIIVLAQLIGFISYQSRLLCGLSAIQQYINDEIKDEQ